MVLLNMKKVEIPGDATLNDAVYLRHHVEEDVPSNENPN